ncbi:MAG: calcium/sodium antiporter [Acidobacteriota bacterium]|nr:calcium/sodium antiporter [Blastocatellia bacterium]MDW8413139.1 calcium/sodium antiporter [Acidobacteriota bacterium]
MLDYFLLFVGLPILLKSADLLVEGASSLAKRLAVSDLVIGLTVVAFGTSAPELVVTIVAGIKGNSELVLGNIVGSNIANILLILGLAATVYPLTVHRNTVWKEIPLSLLSAVVIALMANDALIDRLPASVVSRIDGAVLVCFFSIFLYYTYGIAKAGGEVAEETFIVLGLFKSAVFIVLGLLGLVLGGEWIVSGAVGIAQKLGMSERLIGLTIIAVGTSLPELAASVMAAFRHKTDIAVGNAIGSNIFNSFWILGVGAVIRPIPFDTSGNLDMLFMIGANVLLFGYLFIGERHRVSRWQGIFSVYLYLVYIVIIVLRRK